MFEYEVSGPGRSGLRGALSPVPDEVQILADGAGRVRIQVQGGEVLAHQTQQANKTVRLKQAI